MKVFTMNQFPRTGRLLGVDFGLRRIGLAVCDEAQRFATPYAVYQRRGAASDAQYFRQLVQREHIEGVIIGLPIHADGRESQLSREARRFGEWLSEQTGKPVRFFDERYTTLHAESLLRDAGLSRSELRQKRDMVAAQIILSVYLEAPQLADQSNEPLEDLPDVSDPFP